MKSYSLVDLSNRILRHFIHIEEVKWRFGDKKRVPSQSEIERTLEELSSHIDDEPDGTSITLGGIIMNRFGKHKDVYVYIGTLE